jgi:hypothetical protein
MCWDIPWNQQGNDYIHLGNGHFRNELFTKLQPVFQ